VDDPVGPSPFKGFGGFWHGEGVASRLGFIVVCASAIPAVVIGWLWHDHGNSGDDHLMVILAVLVVLLIAIGTFLLTHDRRRNRD
jgi:undecaprenyl pyrophosphate phosphatase UppP